MNVSGTTVSATGHKGGLGDGLYDRAGARPDLDLDFARTKSLKDRVSKEDLITFTRSTTASGSHTGATYVDEKGYINRAGSNLIKYSQDLSQSDWTKTNSTTFTGNNVVAPDGTLTAGTWSVNAVGYGINAGGTNDTIIDPSSTSTSSSAPLGGSFANAPFPSDGSWIRGRTYPFTVPSTANNSLVVFPLVGSGSIYQIVPVINGEDYVYSAWIRKDPSTGKIYTWGVQLEPASNYPPNSVSNTLGQFYSEYVKTTTQPNSAPRFTHDPETLESKGLLIEQAATNLLEYSEDFTQNYWDKDAITATANATTAPDGTSTATKLEVDNNSTQHRLVKRNFSLGPNIYIFSVWVKANTSSHVLLKIYKGGATGDNILYHRFKLDTEQVTNTAGSLVVEKYPNDWYRLIGTTIADSNTAAASLHVALLQDSDYPETYTGNGESIYVWGAQLEQSNVETSYIPTSGSTVTRSPDLVSIEGDNFGTYRKNKVVDTKSFLHSFGVKSSVRLERHAAANPVTGEYDAVKVIGGTSTGGDAHIQTNLQAISAVGAPIRVIADGTRVVFSFYARTDPGQTFAVRPKMGRNNAAGLYNNPTITITDTWQRYEYDDNGATLSLTKALFGLQFTEANTTIYTYGWQVEERAAPATSFIPSTDTYTSRQSNATFVDGNGIIRTAHKNLIPWSEAFGIDDTGSQHQWQNGNVQLSYDANHINPDGTAGTFYGNNSTSGHSSGEVYRFFEADSSNTDTLTFSLFCKRRDSNSQFIHIEVFAAVVNPTYGTNGLLKCCIFNPEDGTFHTDSGTNDDVSATAPLVTTGGINGRIITNRTAENYGNGWWRVSFTVQLNGDSNQTPVFTNSSRFDIQNFHQCYIWGAQVVKGTEAGDYYKTTGTASGPPRYSHDPDTLTPTGLYLEPAAVNYALQSARPDLTDDLDANNPWRIAGAIFETDNGVTNPDGTIGAKKLIPNSVYTRSHVSFFSDATTLATDVCTLSVFVKAAGYNRVCLISQKQQKNSRGVSFDLTSGTIQSVSTNSEATDPTAPTASGEIHKYPNGWFRLVVHPLTSENPSHFIIHPHSSNSASVVDGTPNSDNFFRVSYSGDPDSGDGIYIWGAQLEETSYVTSYIPTKDSQVDRTADIFDSTATEVLDRANGTKPAFYTKNGLTVFSQFDNGKVLSSRIFEFGTGTTMHVSATMTSLNRLGSYQPNDVVAHMTASSTALIGGENKLALRYAPNDLKLFTNGNGGPADGSVAINPSTKLTLGDWSQVSSPTSHRCIEGTINRLTIWKTPFTDSKLDKLTTAIT